MSWFNLGAPDAGRHEPDDTAGAAATARRRRARRIWLSITIVVLLAALIAGTGAWLARQGHGAAPSWAPRPREIGGLRAIATSSALGYSLYTAHGPVHFLPGVDLGATTPGHQPGELAITAGDYRRWLNEMGWFGIRTVRIYTIHPPAFYNALAAYDRAHPDAPIYLMQGVYLPNDVYLQKGDLYDPAATATFRQELRDASAAVHGTLSRAPARGRASGRWTTNVSQWTAGWIIGVEWDPAAVASTDGRNKDAPAAHGRYFRSTPDATPTERWIAARMNDIATAEAASGWTVPIAFVNWPTTDPLHHPNEPNPREDIVGVDANHVLPTPAWPGGTFASYHVYPYYPDFLRYQPSLQHFDLNGRLDPYAAYLRALQLHHQGVMPVMITEFGVPSSLGSAHTGTLGRSQGDHSEREAMQTDAQMLRDIHDLGMAGAFIFEWTDEWYKKTWNTQLHQLPPDRVELWHDTFTNEQYFGLVATDPLGTGQAPAVIYRNAAAQAAGDVRQVTASTDESYIHLSVRFGRPPSGTLTVGLDTVASIVGPPPPGSGDVNADYALALDLNRRMGQAWVRDRLDPDVIDYVPIPAGARPAAQGGWRPLELVTDRPWLLPVTHEQTVMEFDNAGLLRYGYWIPGRSGYSNLALWHLDGATVSLRIGWAMAGIADPSSHQALIPLGMGRATSVTINGIGVTITSDGGPVQAVGTVRWNDWQSVRYQERIKPGAAAVRAAFTVVGGVQR
jgi:hypothetical protein